MSFNHGYFESRKSINHTLRQAQGWSQRGTQSSQRAYFYGFDSVPFVHTLCTLWLNKTFKFNLTLNVIKNNIFVLIDSQIWVFY
jgi:hypothetical protein